MAGNERAAELAKTVGLRSDTPPDYDKTCSLLSSLRGTGFGEGNHNTHYKCGRDIDVFQDRRNRGPTDRIKASEINKVVMYED
ncbi:hypothetical protein EVAR_21199_1 [Eumeta japonica]|uniref:Uncharacterized protein n=1 Tax=Eumeta variegata TaxID=151549 RepID=A0A4C1UP12_EUMVA|nr:hypothetical protein EVAR_21199_1 [Eumeta japonica]